MFNRWRLIVFWSSKLPYWIQSIVPKIFYVTEKAWNYYPFTITGKRYSLPMKTKMKTINDLEHFFISCMGNGDLCSIYCKYWGSTWMPCDYLTTTTLTFQCSFIPTFHISINTRYENNNGSSENVSYSSVCEWLYRLIIILMIFSV